MLGRAVLAGAEEDVREWLFQIENTSRINNIPIEDASTRLPGIAGSTMEKPALGWFLHWSSQLEARSTRGGFSVSMCSNTSRRRTTKLSCVRIFNDSSRQQTSSPTTASTRLSSFAPKR
ncbi:hypothetical protein PC116_g15300 [Phytophthora cactorum]|uniref:Uncharacterized protein n=1 Tax=Phytophthora cactorum TaxID=29920 RepID=A0A329RQR7_9STRA|nr:hypothetical protein Pcac1_g9334 [Phytophthora cactorum]KAG2882446.1 hypothetical protein PC114_g21041 [Phytophthora cactorum]KAG2917916.1 hypothetical protein PC117_g17256 [Phytophthora cactorum]KAG2996196.1 hypothetical protein PC119_g17899 [Phytophthora cactorum]KAG3029193.1 hypothetical protein PC120_g4442 [Phytophthora cactorum]